MNTVWKKIQAMLNNLTYGKKQLSEHLAESATNHTTAMYLMQVWNMWEDEICELTHF